MSDTGKFSRTTRIDILPDIMQEGLPEAGGRPAARRGAPVARAESARPGDADFQALLQQSYDAALVTQESGVIADANARAQEFLGYSRDELRGSRLENVVSGWTPGLLQTVRQSLDNDRFVLLQAYCLRQDGTVFPAEIAIMRLHLAAGVFLCFFVRDITLRNEADKRLRATLADLARSNSDLEHFAYVVSHDLQEPLRKMTQFGELFRGTGEMDTLSDDARGYLSRILNSAAHMTALIQGVLALSRISTRAGTRERVSLDRTVGEVLADLELRLRDSGGRVEAGELPDLEAEPVQMRQLMQNLIGNALKFHKPGVPPCVRVYARPAEEAERDAVGEDAVAIVVEDDGIGFDPAQSDRIFNIFQRLHTRQEYEGTGIGLAVCRKIVERHGGRIRAESEPGRGARFVIVLPRTAEAEE